MIARLCAAAALIASVGMADAVAVRPRLGAAASQTVRAPKPYKSGIDLTTINVTVVDAAGALVTGLPRDDFEVREDGELQRVTQFTAERVPVGLGVLLDTSDSMFGRRIRDAREAVDEFLFDHLEPADEFFLIAFNHASHVLAGWTGDRGTIREALAAIKPTGGTAIYDALNDGLGFIARRNRARGAVVIISDGADTASTATIREIRAALLRSDAFVYAVAIDSPERQPINTRVNAAALREITDQSGGRTLVVHDSTELAAATARIAEELKSQYLIGYTAAHGADGKYHSIRVRVRGSGYRVRARNGYVAER